MRGQRSNSLLLITAAIGLAGIVEGCTNLIVTPGASQDGSAMLAYNTDDFELFGSLYHYPAANYTGARNKTKSGKARVRHVYDWDSSRYLGSIPEAEHTHNVVSNCNDQGVCIGETTFGGVEELQEQPGATIDYGSLMWLALQRSSTALQAVKTMSHLVTEFGYASEGETFSIVDTKEAWIMDVISKGKHELGAVWVAQRVPDGTVAAHANYAFTRTFPRDDPKNCLFAPDVVAFARKTKLYDGEDADFDFSEVYDPEPAFNLRYAATRIWDIYGALVPDSQSFYEKYFDFATAQNPNNRIPLWIEPKEKLTLDDVRERMASHYENTTLDYRYTVASGVFESPYRPRPQSWQYKNKTYVNERNIGAAKTGINFIAVLRPHVPKPLRALLWFAVDDASTAPRIPVYASSTRVSKSYAGRGQQHGVTIPTMRFDMKQAFWVQNMVSNLVYSRWRDAFPYLKDKLEDVQERFVQQVAEVEQRALNLYKVEGTTDAAVIEILTNFSVMAGDVMHAEWIDFYGTLFARYRDFVTMEEDPNDIGCGCNTVEVGYDDVWKERIIAETGDHFEVPDDLPEEEDEEVKKRGRHHRGKVSTSGRGIRRAHWVLGVAVSLVCLSGLVGFFVALYGRRARAGRSILAGYHQDEYGGRYSPSGTPYQALRRQASSSSENGNGGDDEVGAGQPMLARGARGISLPKQST